MATPKTLEGKIQYSKLLSSLFCSVSIFLLSILSLLNSLSLDMYSMMCLLKVVVPAGASFWFLGFVIGTILDRYDNKIIVKKKVDETKAYEIPSIFAGSDVSQADNDLGGIL